jgi:hypothetical protein
MTEESALSPTTTALPLDPEAEFERSREALGRAWAALGDAEVEAH